MKLCACIVVFCTVALHAAEEDRAFVARQLRKAGVDSLFSERITRDSSVTLDASRCRINVTNFARRPDYSHHHNKKGVREVKKFIRAHRSLLTALSKKYKVTPEAIASILWVESKFGRTTGRNHVASTFLSVILCADPDEIENSVSDVVTKGVVDTNNIDSLRSLVERRTVRKAAWAAREVQALQRLEQERNVNIMALRGSWAGAMGWPQFLPSSLLQWGADGNGDKRVDLHTMPDAAASVARYLHEHGWGTTIASQRAAVFAYNNSNDYVTAVLTLARKAYVPPKKKKR